MHKKSIAIYKWFVTSSNNVCFLCTYLLPTSSPVTFSPSTIVKDPMPNGNKPHSVCYNLKIKRCVTGDLRILGFKAGLLSKILMTWTFCYLNVKKNFPTASLYFPATTFLNKKPVNCLPGAYDNHKNWMLKCHHNLNYKFYLEEWDSLEFQFQ